MKTIRILSIIICLGFLGGCTNEPEKITLKDENNISESLKSKLKNDYGMYILKEAKITSTSDFNKLKLILLGEREPNMEMSIFVTGLQKTNKLLFNSALSVIVSDNMSCPNKVNPCVTQNQNNNIEGNSFPTVIEIYSKDVDYSSIIGKYLNKSEINSVFLMKRTYSSNFSEILFEISF